MPPIEELSILVPVDVSTPDTPRLDILDVLRPFDVILLGYFPVPDQAEPAMLKHEYEDEAAARLDEIAAGRGEVTEVLVFTHDRDATVDRIAEEYECDAVLTAGDIDQLDRILVALRGDVNVTRIVSVVANLLLGSDATATVLHAVDENTEPNQGESLLQSTVDRVIDQGIEDDRLDRQLVTDGDPRETILALETDYDLVVFGETEPTLRERIIGAFLSSLIDELDRPALIVRDVE